MQREETVLADLQASRVTDLGSQPMPPSLPPRPSPSFHARNQSKYVRRSESLPNSSGGAPPAVDGTGQLRPASQSEEICALNYQTATDGLSHADPGLGLEKIPSDISIQDVAAAAHAAMHGATAPLSSEHDSDVSSSDCGGRHLADMTSASSMVHASGSHAAAFPYIRASRSAKTSPNGNATGDAGDSPPTDVDRMVRRTRSAQKYGQFRRQHSQRSARTPLHTPPTHQQRQHQQQQQHYDGEGDPQAQQHATLMGMDPAGLLGAATAAIAAADAAPSATEHPHSTVIPRRASIPLPLPPLHTLHTVDVSELTAVTAPSGLDSPVKPAVLQQQRHRQQQHGQGLPGAFASAGGAAPVQAAQEAAAIRPDHGGSSTGWQQQQQQRDEGESLQSFSDYLRAEAYPADKLPTTDVVWGQSERDRVYNFLMYVPYQVERLIQLGTLLCLDSFLGIMTFLPCRCMVALVRLAKGLARRSRRRRSSSGGGSTAGVTPSISTPSITPTGASSSNPAAVALRLVGSSSSISHRRSISGSDTGGQFISRAQAQGSGGMQQLQPSGRGRGASGSSAAGMCGAQSSAGAVQNAILDGSQLFDLLCMAILLLGTALLRAVKPGFIYYWLKDITSEFLKMSVLSAAFEIADKILCNFGMDVLEALSGTCTLWVMGSKPTSHLVSDACVAFVIVVLHGITLMCQGLVLAVALNSKRNGLLALLIANNFVEIKGAVFKRWDMPRIWQLACMDIVERMHLMAVLLFVVVEDMESSGVWLPSASIMFECARIMGSEVIIDVLKHAVLGKFNDIRPGVYREFMKDMCEKACSAQSHTLHKLLGFHHLAAGTLVLRTAFTLFWMRYDGPGSSGSDWLGSGAATAAGSSCTSAGMLGSWWAAYGQLAARAAVAFAVWLALLLFKPLFGYALKAVSFKYVQYYNRHYQKIPARAGASAPRAAHAADTQPHVHPQQQHLNILPQNAWSSPLRKDARRAAQMAVAGASSESDYATASHRAGGRLGKKHE